VDVTVYMPFTSSCLIVSNFALCGMPFLAGFYSKDFILEIFSMRYINVLGFLLLFLSTGLTVCYSFRLFYFAMCGDFNFSPSYSCRFVWLCSYFISVPDAKFCNFFSN
jgi:NADH-ubiquinone oxidoreductase chain 5